MFSFFYGPFIFVGFFLCSLPVSIHDAHKFTCLGNMYKTLLVPNNANEEYQLQNALFFNSIIFSTLFSEELAAVWDRIYLKISLHSNKYLKFVNPSIYMVTLKR